MRGATAGQHSDPSRGRNWARACARRVRRASHAIARADGDVHLLRDARRIVGRGDRASDHEHVGAGGRDLRPVCRCAVGRSDHPTRVGRRGRPRSSRGARASPLRLRASSTRRRRTPRRSLRRDAPSNADASSSLVSTVTPSPSGGACPAAAARLRRVRRVRPATSRHHPRCGSSRRRRRDRRAHAPRASDRVRDVVELQVREHGQVQRAQSLDRLGTGRGVELETDLGDAEPRAPTGARDARPRRDRGRRARARGGCGPRCRSRERVTEMTTSSCHAGK